MIKKSFFSFLSLIVFCSLFFSNIILAKNLKIMNYNVENLFDTIHDANRKDYTYMPVLIKRNSQEIQTFCATIHNRFFKYQCLSLDWNKKVLDQKLNNLAKVINLENPDIITFQEVENIHVLQLLNKKLNNKYHTILIEGPDKRGIDVAALSKYKLSRPAKLHKVDLSKIIVRGKPERPTRSILELNFKINFQNITFLVNHWPSPSHPEKARMAAAKTVLQIINQTDDLVVVVGDFNTIRLNNNTAIDKMFLNPNNPIVLKDAKTTSHFKKISGTHAYKGSWSYLDHFFILKNKSSSSKVNWKSFNVVSYPFMLTKLNGNVAPFRFNPKSKSGYSDHLPITLNISL